MKAALRITKDDYCWLFGGFGFHNSEATMTGIMSARLKNEFVLKSFREISPTFSRVFAGFVNWTKEAMDAFADYYDETFRRSGTTLYIVPGRMPYMSLSFDAHAYAEKVAENLEYLVKVRACKHIRYYCVTNEMSVGNTYCYFSRHLDEFKRLHEELYDAFVRHGLDIGLLATDTSGFTTAHTLDWAMENMDEITEAYCWHNYQLVTPEGEKLYAGDPQIYPRLLNAYGELVQNALKKEKRFILGEFGIQNPAMFRAKAMRNDVCSGFNDEKEAALTALTLAEEEMAALNAGIQSAAYWTFMDYPDPFFREDGDSPEEKSRYDCARFSGHGLSIRYNKWGLFRWDDEKGDYSARASLYTLGPIARYFRKGSRVLTCESGSDSLFCGAVCCRDGGVSVCIINHADEVCDVEIDCALGTDKPYRCFSFDTANVPYNPFNDLQPFTVLTGNRVSVPAMGMVLLTTDYTDRVPSPIENVRIEDGILSWDPCTDAEHCYYRVFADGCQIASTVGTSLAQEKLPAGEYSVISVDEWGNTGSVCGKSRKPSFVEEWV